MLRRFVLAAIAFAIASPALADTITGRIVKIDPEKRTVTLSDKTYMLVDKSVDLTAVPTGEPVTIATQIDENGIGSPDAGSVGANTWISLSPLPESGPLSDAAFTRSRKKKSPSSYLTLRSAFCLPSMFTSAVRIEKSSPSGGIHPLASQTSRAPSSVAGPST